jgi:hypothetical protein
MVMHLLSHEQMRQKYETPQTELLSLENQESFLVSGSPVVPREANYDKEMELMEEETYVW